MFLYGFEMLEIINIYVFDKGFTNTCIFVIQLNTSPF